MSVVVCGSLRGIGWGWGVFDGLCAPSRESDRDITIHRVKKYARVGKGGEA